MKTRNLWQGAAIGAACGLVASAVMSVVPAIWSRLEKKTGQQEPSGGEQDEDATVKTARRIAEPILGRELTEDEKKAGGPLVHYAFGTSVGALYGALVQVLPAVAVAGGTAYATAVWLLGDELTVPALGLAPSPTEQPASGHFKYWLTHVVYGATLDGSRRLIEAQLD